MTRDDSEMSSPGDEGGRDLMPYEVNRIAWRQTIAGSSGEVEGQRIRWQHLHFEAFTGSLETLLRVRAGAYLEEFRDPTRLGAYAELLGAMGDTDPGRPPNFFGVVDALGFLGWEAAAIHYSEDTYIYCIFKAQL